MQHPSIQLLDSSVIDHIAAGEVVERPASVVKELVENAFDAGSQLVQVDLEGGGLACITVTDDGRGMSPDDARLCVLRHATSKLRQSEDLFCITTLGFRGEALSSIASVSDFSLTTRRAKDPTGFRLILRGGVKVSEEMVGCPRGTSIQVKNLFFNTPARRKFMRAPATEQAHVVDAALRVGMGLRRGGLLVMAGARRLLDIPDNATGEARIAAALGTRVKNLAPLFATHNGIRIEGFVSPPEIARADTKGLWLFVNGRFVRDRMLQRALLESYPTLAPGRYPTAIVYIEVDPEAVDVNVHPQKLEVRFADATSVYRALTSALHNVLPASTAAEPAPPGQPTPSPEASESPLFNSEAWFPAPSSAEASAYAAEAPRVVPVAPSGFFGRLALWGKVGTFWIAQGKHATWLLHGEAAARWLAHAVLGAQLEEGRIAVHNLLFPMRIEVPRTLLLRLRDGWESLQALGFEVEPAGPDTFILKAIPQALMHAQSQALMHTCLTRAFMGGDVDTFDAAHARDVLAHCAEHVDAPTETADIQQLLQDLDLQGMTPDDAQTRPWLRRMEPADLQRVFSQRH